MPKLSALLQDIQFIAARADKMRLLNIKTSYRRNINDFFRILAVQPQPLYILSAILAAVNMLH